MTEAEKAPENVLFDMPLRRLEAIATAAERYRPSDTHWYPKKGELYHRTYRHGDYEGSPTEYLELTYMRGQIDNFSGSTQVWSINFQYDQAFGENYDYTKLVRKDRSTAHRMRVAGPPSEVRFKLAQSLSGTVDGKYLAHLSTLPEEKIRQFHEDLLYLERAFVFADGVAASIESWVSSGMGVRIFCNCSPPKDMPGSWLLRLYELGNSLTTIQDRLKCRACGKRPYGLKPPDYELNENFNKSLQSRDD